METLPRVELIAIFIRALMCEQILKNHTNLIADLARFTDRVEDGFEKLDAIAIDYRSRSLLFREITLIYGVLRAIRHPLGTKELIIGLVQRPDDMHFMIKAFHIIADRRFASTKVPKSLIKGFTSILKSSTWVKVDTKADGFSYRQLIRWFKRGSLNKVIDRYTTLRKKKGKYKNHVIQELMTGPRDLVPKNNLSDLVRQFKQDKSRGMLTRILGMLKTRDKVRGSGITAHDLISVFSSSCNYGELMNFQKSVVDVYLNDPALPYPAYVVFCPIGLKNSEILKASLVVEAILTRNPNTELLLYVNDNVMQRYTVKDLPPFSLKDKVYLLLNCAFNDETVRPIRRDVPSDIKLLIMVGIAHDRFPIERFSNIPGGVVFEISPRCKGIERKGYGARLPCKSTSPQAIVQILRSEE